MNEFELIRRYFVSWTPARADVLAGVGDDCALLQPPPGEALAVTTDTLIAGRHFPLDAVPADIGWKSLAVNLSDLAAMGATPRWFTLALSLPDIDEDWLQAFTTGMREVAADSGIVLAGGDTTRGPLSITVTAIGTTPDTNAMRRSGARVGDAICVTGTLGDAALGLKLWQRRSFCRDLIDTDQQLLWGRLHRPQPRIAAGLSLRGMAHAAIDLSDGLAGDLKHILDASRVGALIHVDRLPKSVAFGRYAAADDRFALQVSGGDDYELCVCLPADRVDEARAQLDVSLVEIGRITEEPALQWVNEKGQTLAASPGGYDHFQ